MNRVQILHLFLIDGTDLSDSKCSQLSGARPVLDFYTLTGSEALPCRCPWMTLSAGPHQYPGTSPGGGGGLQAVLPVWLQPGPPPGHLMQAAAALLRDMPVAGLLPLPQPGGFQLPAH